MKIKDLIHNKQEWNNIIDELSSEIKWIKEELSRSSIYNHCQTAIYRFETSLLSQNVVDIMSLDFDVFGRIQRKLENVGKGDETYPLFYAHWMKWHYNPRLTKAFSGCNSIKYLPLLDKTNRERFASCYGWKDKY